MKLIRTAISTIVFLAAASAFAEKPRYVFLFIGDGMSTPQRMVADEFSRACGNGPLAMNSLPYQSTMRTCSLTSMVTDSAAAATAMACGAKTRNGAIGTDKDGNPLESCAYVAHKAGKKVGIITTVTITHATPAAFYARRKNRGELYGISVDLANSGFEFFAGGGLDNKYKDKRSPDFAKYGHAYRYAESKGYKIVRNKEDFLALKPSDGKVLTRFRNGCLDNAIDADGSLPSIAEMVSKAVEMLDGDGGFFIMAEGGRIDWSAHANDAATNLRDVIALDDAVKVALVFLDTHPAETLVLVVGDHETGGLAMGFAGTGYAIYVDRLAGQTKSVGAFEQDVGKLYGKRLDVSFDEVKPLIEGAFGLRFGGDPRVDPMVLTKDELAEIEKAFAHDNEFHKAKVEENPKYDGEKRYLLGGACRLVLSHKAGLGWSSGAHTAMPTLTTAKGIGAERFSGSVENDEFGRRLKDLCGR